MVVMHMVELETVFQSKLRQIKLVEQIVMTYQVLQVVTHYGEM